VIETGKMEIDWRLKVPKPRNADGTGDMAYGKSITRAYVTGGVADAGTYDHTVVHLGSVGAKGTRPPVTTDTPVLGCRPASISLSRRA
jgi:hypothetical protein